MKKLMIAVGAALVAGATLAASSFAYQGMLRDEHGAVKQGLTEAIINFRLYLSPTENEVKWGRCVTVSLATNGLFNVELSDSAGTALVEDANLDDVIATATKQGFPLYLGLEVKNSAGEIRPRQKLTPAPLATFAQNVAEAKGNFTIASNAFVSGNLMLSDTTKSLTVKGKAEINELTVSSSSTFETMATFKSGIKVAGTLDATTVKQEGNVLIPKGTIVMWTGTTAPDGWALCDGNNGTPNLKGRFIVGYDPNDGDYNAVSVSGGKTGGAKKVTLTVNEMPPHRHVYYGDDRIKVLMDGTLNNGSGADTQWFNGEYVGEFHPNANQERWVRMPLNSDLAVQNNKQGQEYTSGRSDTPKVYKSGIAGGSNMYGGDQLSHENRPPYYALAYIMKL